MNENHSFHLVVHGREGTLYQGMVQAVTSFNETGRFDILGQHANFISLVSKAVIIRQLDNTIKEIKINSGLLRTRNNNVEIYIGIEQIRLPLPVN